MARYFSDAGGELGVDWAVSWGVEECADDIGLGEMEFVVDAETKEKQEVVKIGGSGEGWAVGGWVLFVSVGDESGFVGGGAGGVVDFDL